MFASKSGSTIITVTGVIAVSFTVSTFRLSYAGEMLNPSDAEATYSDVSVIYNMAYGKIFPITTRGLLPALSKTQWILNTGSPRVMFALDNYGINASFCDPVLTIYDGTTTSSTVIFRSRTCDRFPSSWLFSSSSRVLIVLENGPRVGTANFEVLYYGDTDLFNCGSLYLPDILTANTMIITDGSPSSVAMRRFQACSWLITSGASDPVNDNYYPTSYTLPVLPTDRTDTKLTLLFPWVNMKFGSRVLVYDGEDDSGVMLWDSLMSGPTTVVPPPLRSTGRSLYVTYSSNSFLSLGFRGFQGEYLTRAPRSKGIGSAVEKLTMSSAIDISPPGYACARAVSDCSFSGGLKYSWAVSPSNGRDSIYFIFSQLSLLSAGDELSIYDGDSPSGPVLRRWTGGNTPLESFPFHWIVTSGPDAYVTINSNKSRLDSEGGFKFSFYSDGPNYHCGFSVNPAVLSGPTHIITDGSAAAQYMYSFQSCEWRVDPYNNRGGVTLLFDRFDMSSGAAITVFKERYNNETGTFSRRLFTTIKASRAVPVPISSSDSLYLSFQSGSSPVGTGFSASYFSAQGLHTTTGTGVIELRCSR
jgi:hypothetical protein